MPAEISAGNYKEVLHVIHDYIDAKENIMGRKEDLYRYISEANSEITTLTNEINELNSVLTKVNSVLTDLDNTKNTSTTNLELKDFMDGTKSEIADGFYTGLSNVLTGENFTKVSTGVTDTIADIQALITKKQDRITECNNNISSWQAEIDAIIAAEQAAAEEAARAAQQQSQG